MQRELHAEVAKGVYTGCVRLHAAKEGHCAT